MLDGRIDEAFSFPLIDQNKNYAWTEVRLDKAQYEFIRDGGLYLVKNSGRSPADLDACQPFSGVARLGHAQGDLATQMTEKDDKGRYYTVDAMLYNPDTKRCDQTLMGLVGFHIVHKLEQFPEWIWSRLRAG